jgi:hypothetical protein
MNGNEDLLYFSLEKCNLNCPLCILGAIQVIRDTLRGGGGGVCAKVSPNDTGEGGKTKVNMSFLCPFSN